MDVLEDAVAALKGEKETAEKRRGIARKAAEARWNKDREED